MISKNIPLTLLLVFLFSSPLRSAEERKPQSYQSGAPSARVNRITVTPLPFRNPLDNLDPRAYDNYVNGLLLTEIDDLVDAAASFRKSLEYFPESFEIGFALATTYYNMRKPNEALDVLSRLAPRNADVYLLSAACFRVLGDGENAKEANLKVIQLDSGNVSALNFLANVYRQMNKPDSLLWVYEKLVKAAPGANSNIWNDIGKLRAQSGDLVRARDAFHMSISLNPGSVNAMAYAALGELYDMAKVPDSAVLVLERGLKVADNNLLLHKAMIAHYLKLDSLTPAIPHGRKICELMPFDKDAMRRLAILCFSADSLRSADSIFSYLESGKEREPANHFYLGQIAIREKDYARALREFKTLTQLADTSADSWLALGNVYRLQNQLQHELEVYTEGVNHMVAEENALRLLFAIGATQERTGLFEQAVATFHKILSKAPGHSQSLNYLGYMLADRGVELDSARSYIERALTIEPDNAAFLDSYGWVHYRLGDYSKSVDYLHKAADLVADSVVYDHLGDALKAKGDSADARVWWEKALQLAPDNAVIREKLGR